MYRDRREDWRSACESSLQKVYDEATNHHEKADAGACLWRRQELHEAYSRSRMSHEAITNDAYVWPCR